MAPFPCDCYKKPYEDPLTTYKKMRKEPYNGFTYGDFPTPTEAPLEEHLRRQAKSVGSIAKKKLEIH